MDLSWVMNRPCVLHHVWESLEPKLWESFEKFSLPNRWKNVGPPFLGRERICFRMELYTPEDASPPLVDYEPCLGRSESQSKPSYL